MFINAPTDNLTLSRPAGRDIDRDLLDRFAKAPAANVGDVFDRLLVLDGGIRPFTSHTRLVGTALPILTRAGDNLAIHRALDDAQPGDVLVINGQGDLSRALIGDLIGEIMVSQAASSAPSSTASSATPKPFRRPGPRPSSPAPPPPPARSRTAPASSAHPVAVGGVVVSAGDLIVTDSDGVVLVPRHQRPHRAADLVHQVIEKEEALRRRILAARG